MALLAAALLGPQRETRVDSGLTLGDPWSGEENGLVLQNSDRLEPPKLSPKAFDNGRWEFDWVTSGFGRPSGTDQLELRFRVFSQQRHPQRDLAERVAVMDVRMWQLLYRKYRIDHPQLERGLRLVDQYLCWGGTAGGEQMLTQDKEAGASRRANVIYIYDIASFRDPLEMAREIAHEYGHAVLPAVGGFKKPEAWANGYLGEKLFLRWLRDAFRSGHIDSSSVMGASYAQLDSWVRRRVDPLVLAAATSPPKKALLGSGGQRAMDAFVGLVLYADSILPPDLTGRSLRLTDSSSAADYPAALLEAARSASYTLRPPSYLIGKKVWIPLGTSKLQNAKVLARSGGWAQIQLGRDAVTVLSLQADVK